MASDQPSKGRDWPQIALLSILVAYAATQVVVILLGTGLFLSHDEANFLIEGMRLPVQRKQIDYTHGPVLYELMAALELTWYLLARVAGHVHSPVEHLADLLANPAPHVKAARLLVAGAGVLCLVAIERLARFFTTRWGAVLAALLTATSLTFGVWTGLAKEDALCWFLLFAAGNAMWRASPTERLRPALAGIAIGVGFATKYTAFFGMALAFVPLLRRDRERAQALRQAAIMAGAALISVLVVFPFLLTDRAGVIGSLKYTSTALAKMSPTRRAYAYLFHHLPTVCGPVVGIAALGELAVRLKTERRGPILLFIPLLLILAFLTPGRGYTAAHYVYPIALGAFVLAAASAVRVSQRLKGRARALPYAVLLGVIVLDPAFLPSRLKFALLVSGPDTRVLAAKRVEALVPAGECVVLTGGIVGWNDQGPDLAPSEPSGTNPAGLFAAAERAAIPKRPPPHYRLRIVHGHDMPDDIPAECDWLVGHHIGDWSTLELDPPKKPGYMPTGFDEVEEVRAIPATHSYLFPFLSHLDYEEIERTPFSQLLAERAMGPTYLIYKRRPHDPGTE